MDRSLLNKLNIKSMKNPYAYQDQIVIDVFEKLKTHRLCYLAAEVRTGKSYIIASVINNILKNSSISDVLVVTKKKAIPGIEQALGAMNAQNVFVVNFEMLHKLFKNEYGMVIVDEAHNIGAFPKRSLRARQLTALGRKAAVVLLMSGTPAPESWSQLYHQFSISRYSPWAHYKTFYTWAKDYVIERKIKMGGLFINDYKKTFDAKIHADCQKHFVVLTQEEAGFMVFPNEVRDYVEMTGLQRKCFDDIRKHKTTTVFGTTVIASSVADAMNKCSQICGGSILDGDGKVIFVGTEKLKQMSLYEDYKIAVFYKYKAERTLIETYFQTTDDPEEFERRDDLVFCGQFLSIREGVSLKSADKIIMWNIDYSATTYHQAIARLQNRERTKPAEIVWLFCRGGIEERVYSAVVKKKNYTSRIFNKWKL